MAAGLGRTPLSFTLLNEYICSEESRTEQYSCVGRGRIGKMDDMNNLSYEEIFMLWRTGEISDYQIEKYCLVDANFAKWLSMKRQITPKTHTA